MTIYIQFSISIFEQGLIIYTFLNNKLLFIILNIKTSSHFIRSN